MGVVPTFSKNKKNMGIHTEKKGIRILGIAESFKKSNSTSTLAGIVIRRDMVVDGIVLGRATLGGDDSTLSILSMLRQMKRNDINCIMLDGLIISMYNIINGGRIYADSGVPVLAITFRESAGLEDAIRYHFPTGNQAKLIEYSLLGQREPVLLKTGKRVFIRYWGLSYRMAVHVINSFTLQGAIPEPIRIAKLIARAHSKSSSSCP